MDRINGRTAASARNQHFQRLSPEEEAAIRDWILRLQAWGWPSRVKQVRSIVKELAKSQTLLIHENIGYTKKLNYLIKLH